METEKTNVKSTPTKQKQKGIFGKQICLTIKSYIVDKSN